MSNPERFKIIDTEQPDRIMNMSADEVQLMLTLAERHRSVVDVCPKCNSTMAATYRWAFVCGGCGHGD